MPTGLQPVPSSTDAPSAGRATADAPVFLNNASLDELQRLPGIGPKRAKAIFDLRVRLGRFRHVEDLARVKGIGKATIKRLKPLVRLDAPP
jgi:competence protein ComEA